MRSKTLSSEKTILKKDLTRFAPVWLGLCAYLAIWATTIITAGQNFGDYYEPVAPIFAPILALVVFGYLCDPKECNMVHSLPIRRERLFIIHVVAASLMFLVPTAIFCVLTGPYATQGALYRFVFMGLEFFFLFSIGVLCMMLTGRKIGAALLYLFIQCLTLIVGAILEFLYLPMLSGIYIDSAYYLMSPMAIVSSYADFMYDTNFPPDAWAFIAVIGGLSLAIQAVSMILYHKRKLEHAGDLLSVTWLNPFFAVCSGLTGASVMAVFGYDTEVFQLLLGCAIGYLSYWMLSKKTARVFTQKILIGFVCLVAAMFGSMYLTYLDPLDRVYHVPEPGKVEKVTLSQAYFDSDAFTVANPEIIAGICELHHDMAYDQAPSITADYDPSEAITIHFAYYLENGKVLHREYDCDNAELLNRASWYLSQPEALFKTDTPDVVEIDVRHNSTPFYLDPRLIPELMEVILEECREGKIIDLEHRISGWNLYFELQNPEYHNHISIPATAVKTIAWLEEHCEEIEK